MLTELTDLVGMEVYTHTGIALGNVDDLIIETEERVISRLYISNPNPLLVERSQSIAVPFRWIESVGDVILLKHFPKFVPALGPPKEQFQLKKAAREIAHATEEKLAKAEKALAEELKGVERKVVDELKVAGKKLEDAIKKG
ncbi:MAG: PRC-barrel domain-containing protein [Candidatus Thermoplasmatota archaeon]